MRTTEAEREAFARAAIEAAIALRDYLAVVPDEYMPRNTHFDLARLNTAILSGNVNDAETATIAVKGQFNREIGGYYAKRIARIAQKVHYNAGASGKLAQWKDGARIARLV